MASCKHSLDVVADGWLQKRKYRKGFHIDLAKYKKQEKTFEIGGAQSSPENYAEQKYSDEVPQLIEQPKDSAQRDSPFERLKEIKPKISAWVKDQTEKIQISEDDPPSQEELNTANKKKILGWSVVGVLSLVAIILSFLLPLFIVNASILLFVSVLSSLGTLLLPISIILLIMYGIEHSAIKKNKTIFTPSFLKTTGTFSLVVSIIGAILLLIVAALTVYFLLVLGSFVNLFTEFLLVVLLALLVIFLLGLYSLTLIFSISFAVVSAKKTKAGRISVIIMLAAPVLLILITVISSLYLST